VFVNQAKTLCETQNVIKFWAFVDNVKLQLRWNF